MQASGLRIPSLAEGKARFCRRRLKWLAQQAGSRYNPASMPTEEELLAEIERLKAENEALRRPASKGAITFKVSEKGAVSVYGLGRFPVTLYKEQWEKLLERAGELQAFIRDNEARLKKREA